MPTFRLDQQPWIPVVGMDGCERELSLTQIFEQASSIATLSGNPLEVAAILRFLLAIAHLTETPPNLARWGELWRDRNSFTQRCATYVREQGDLWDLFHPHRPFLQDKRLLGEVTPEPVEPTFLSRGKLGTDAFVSHLSAADIALKPAAAARTLLVTHAFAVGGTGTPNPHLPKRAGNVDDKYSKNSLLAQSLVAFLDDSPLDRLLHLNLLASAKVNMPGWRFPHATTAAPVSCKCLADRYTRPAASILLHPNDDGSVPRATVTIGSTFLRPDPKKNEPGDAIDDPMLPHDANLRQLELEPGKALWRRAHTFLGTSERPLALVSQLQRLRVRGLVDFDVGSLRVTGIAGDRGRVKHRFWRDESLPFGLSVIADDKRYADLVRAISAAEDQAKKTRSRIYSFAARYLQGGSESQPDKKDVGRLADELAPGLTDFWAPLAPTGERIACDGFDETAWHGQLKEASEKAFRRAIDRLPPDARRFRAEFASQKTKSKKPKNGAVA